MIFNKSLYDLRQIQIVIAAQKYEICSKSGVICS